jgi:hypothetical protein
MLACASNSHHALAAHTLATRWGRGRAEAGLTWCGEGAGADTVWCAWVCVQELVLQEEQEREAAEDDIQRRQRLRAQRSEVRCPLL